jgi:DNA polymerase III delta subunit
MRLYDEQRALKVEPQQIIAMLAWQLHVLAVVKTAKERSVEDIARVAKLNPFVVRKTQGIASRITLPRLKELITTLREFDVRTKTEGILPDEVVRYYLLQLSRTT